MENRIKEINDLIKNIPKDLPDMHKVRYVYLTLGKMFSYDLKVLNKETRTKNIVYNENGKIDYVNTCLTCDEISTILTLVLNNIGIDAKTVNRINPQSKVSDNHIACSVMIDKKKYLLDLTLDLYLIQAGMKTTEFGSKEAFDKSYTQIDNNTLAKIDRELGYINDNGYNDNLFENVDKTKNIEERVNDVSKLFDIKYTGILEKHRTAQKVMKEILTPDEKGIMLSYNLFKISEDKSAFLSVFNIASIGDVWYIFDDKIGFRESNIDEVRKYLDNGYNCNNPRIYNDVYGYSKR